MSAQGVHSAMQNALPNAMQSGIAKCNANSNAELQCTYVRTDERTNEQGGLVLSESVLELRAHEEIKVKDEVRSEWEPRLAPVRYPVRRTNRTDERQPIPGWVRFAVYNRDGNACQLCGWTGGYDSGNPLVLDHVVPWSAGGSDRSTNLRTLCWRCNAQRSNWSYFDDPVRLEPVAMACWDCNPDEYTDDLDSGQYEPVQAFCSTCWMTSSSHSGWVA